MKLCIFLDKKSITAKELYEHLGVASRTVYRDIKTLSMAGIPIYTKLGGNGGIDNVD